MKKTLDSILYELEMATGDLLVRAYCLKYRIVPHYDYSMRKFVMKHYR